MTDTTLPESGGAADALVAYWRTCRADLVLPHRAHIAPQKLRTWVGDISVIHLHEGARRFFVALHGENVNRRIGPGMHRKYLEDCIPAASLALAIAPYEESCRRRSPVYSTLEPTLDNRLMYRLTRLILPFYDDDPETVARFLVWVAPNDRKPTDAGCVYPGDDTKPAAPCPAAMGPIGIAPVDAAPT